MPYSGPNDDKLPSYVKKLSEKKRKQWIAVFESTLSDGKSESEAFKYANGVVKRAKKSYDEEWLYDKKLYGFEVNFKPYGATDGQGCATCWFRQNAETCYMMYGIPESTGICDMFRLPPGYESISEEGVLEAIKSLLEAVE